MPVFLIYFALLVVAFFFLIVRPQRRQLAARKALIAAVGVGDEVITAGGIYGVVLDVDDDVLRIEVAPGVVLTVAREAIARRRTDEDEAPASNTQADDGPADAAAED